MNIINFKNIDLHQKDADCSLDLIKQNDTFFSQYTFEESKTFTFNKLV